MEGLATAIDWNTLLSKPEVLALLEHMLAKGTSTVEPTVDEKGGVGYSISDEKSSADSGEVLESMVKAGVLEKKSEGRLLGCPQHRGYFDLSPRLRCPHCSSLNLTKGALLQHSCGYIGAPELFAGVCPHCKKPSPNQTLKAVGTWYECDSCHKRSAQPNVFLFCKSYGHDFAIGLAELLDQATYSLTKEAAVAMKGRLGIIVSVLKGLKAAGMAAEVSGKMTGASGVQHDFDLLVHSGENKIPIDVKVGDDGAVDVVGVLSTYAKALDTKANPTILVAVPEASADARKTAGAYGMVLIEGDDPKAITDRILSAARLPPTSGSGPTGTVGLSRIAT